MNNLPAAQTPFDTLTGALGGLMVGHCLTSVTNFRVADALGDTPQTAAELAAATGTNPEALRRMLRLWPWSGLQGGAHQVAELVIGDAGRVFGP